MSMSTSIKAYIPDTDKEYQKHKKILLLCNESDVDLPLQTAEYFECKFPSLDLLDEKLEVELKKGIDFKEYSNDYEQGFEVDITKLPKGVTKLRFCNGW